MGESQIRVVQKVGEDISGEEDFPMLRSSVILFAAGVNLKLEYAFYILVKQFRKHR